MLKQHSPSHIYKYVYSMYGLPYKVETNTKTYRLKHTCTQKFVLPLSPSSQARIQITWILCMNHMLIP